ncbi:MAG TPA: phosphoribosylformylglycinamidine synthase subunit PurQ [Fibrobacteria bacterium]|nr:phosphoribosylformylglycinamidine synthase subunit PurQ [Fibrobacteria bacterium]HOX50292.1 phosphoribosylformylglycinamidine synthase subunit PurQ [Fibrobacteria bacterium]
MSKVPVLVIAGYGINSEVELVEGFQLAGAEPRRVHLSDIVAGKVRLSDYRIIAFPGGFSFGDHIASGRVLAVKIQAHLGESLREAVAAGTLVLGICNGFQVITKLGLLPLLSGVPEIGAEFQQEATLTFNDSGKFEDRWCPVVANPASPCVWTRGLDRFELPVRHGEGKWIHRDESVRQAILGRHLDCLRYGSSTYPGNPNGSQDDIAGVCDPSGRIFGLMPHPEVFLRGTQHPRWARGEIAPQSEGVGLTILRNGVEAASRG